MKAARPISPSTRHIPKQRGLCSPSHRSVAAVASQGPGALACASTSTWGAQAQAPAAAAAATWTQVASAANFEAGSCACASNTWRYTSSKSSAIRKLRSPVLCRAAASSSSRGSSSKLRSAICRVSSSTSSSRGDSSSRSSSSSSSPSAVSDRLLPKELFDVVVVGAGIGGLSCGALLAYYGFKVLVVEAHSVAGGAAHCWSRRGCNFDSGTALFFGLPAQQQQQSAAAAAATTTSSSGSNSALGNPAAVSAAAGSGAALAASIEGSSSSRGARSPDNPLAAVLQILGQSLDVVPYGPDRTCLVFPEGTFKAQIGSALFPGVVRQLWGAAAEQEWLDLQQLCRDLAQQASGLHPVVVRYDPCIAVTAGLRRPRRFAKFLSSQPDLMKPDLVDSVVSTPALRSFMDVLCKGTSGAAAADISAAYMVRAFAEMYQPGTQLQWPRGGPQAIADALVQGLRAHGGKLLLNSPVASVLEGANGTAKGVVLKNGMQITARKAVVSNASLWDTQKIIPRQAQLPDFAQQLSTLQPTDSFVHLHAVLDWPHSSSSSSSSSSDSGLAAVSQLPVHTYFLAPDLVGDTGWPTLTISTAVDNTLAPSGKQILHAYMAEPYAPWSGLKRGSAAYQELKQQKAEVLWGLIEQVVPCARQHLDWQMVGTPLTHTHFRRRFKGCYGVKEPLNPFEVGSNSSSTKAAAMQPQAVLAMKGLYCCGDNTFPFVGTPAVAASGMWVANTLAPVWKHWRAADVVDP